MHMQGWRKNFWVVRQRIVLDKWHAYVPQKFEFNHSHDYDVIIFALERGSSNFNHFQQAFFDQARGMVRISNIQSKHQDAPFIF